MKSNFLAAADDCGDVKVSTFLCMALFFFPITSKFIVLEVVPGTKLITNDIPCLALLEDNKLEHLFHNSNENETCLPSEKATLLKFKEDFTCIWLRVLRW
jgi:hypothetical protein